MVKDIGTYHRLAQRMLWSLVTIISLLTYVVEIRPFFNSLLGVYYVGLLDGVFTTIIVLVIAFFMFSKKRALSNFQI